MYFIKWGAASVAPPPQRILIGPVVIWPAENNSELFKMDLRQFRLETKKITHKKNTRTLLAEKKSDLIDLNKTQAAVEWLCQTCAAAAEAADANRSHYTEPIFFFVLWTLDPCSSNWPQSRGSKRRGERFIQIKEKIWQWSVWTSQSCSAAPAKIMNCSAHSLASVIGNFEAGCGGGGRGGSSVNQIEFSSLYDRN